MKMFKRGLVVHRHLQLLLLFAFEEEVTLFTCSSVLASSSILRPSHLTPPLADDFDYMARDLQQPKKDDENDLANILQAYSSEAAAQERSAGPPHLHMYNTHEGDPVEDYQNFRSFQQVYGIHLVQRHLEEKDEMKKRARGSLRWIPNTSNPKNQPDTGRRREEQERTSPKSFGGREQASRRSTAEDVDAARTGKILASTLLASTLSGTDSNASDSSRLDSGTSASSISGPVRLEEDYMMNDAQDEVVLSGATSRRAVENDLPTSANVTIQDEHADVDGEVFDHVEEEEEQEILEDAAHLRDVPLRKHHEVETTRLMRLKMCLGRSIFSLLEKTALVGGLIETQLLDCCGERVKSREHAVYLALKKALSEALTLGFGVGKLAWADLLEEVESRGGVQKMADDMKEAYLRPKLLAGVEKLKESLLADAVVKVFANEDESSPAEDSPPEQACADGTATSPSTSARLTTPSTSQSPQRRYGFLASARGTLANSPRRSCLFYYIGEGGAPFGSDEGAADEDEESRITQKTPGARSATSSSHLLSNRRSCNYVSTTGAKQMSSSGSLSTANETSRAQQEQMKIPHAPLLAGGGSSCSTSASAASPAAASSKACALGERNTSGGASCVVSETARCKNLSVRKSLYYVSGVAVLRNALSLVYRLLKIIARRGVLPASRLVIHVLEAAFPDDGAALEDDKHSDDASFHDSREYDEDE